MEDFTPQPVQSPEHDTQDQSEGSLTEPLDTSETEQQAPAGKGKLASFYSSNKWYIWASVLGLIIIGVLTAYALWPRQKVAVEEAKVAISFDAPRTVPAGGEAIYKIKVINRDTETLVNMNLELVYEDGLTYVSSSPKADNLSGSSFAVPNLEPGQNAVVIVKTLAQGDVNDDLRMVARLHYSFENFTSDFTEEQSHTLRLVSSDVVIDLLGPETAAGGDRVIYKINYRNSSNLSIENARIEMTYPDGFVVDTTNPEPSLGNEVWNIGTIEASEAGEIEIVGRFESVSSGEAAEFTAEFLVLDREGEFFTQSSSSFITSIRTRPLNIEQELSGNRTGAVVDPGSTVTAELSVQNNTDIVNTGMQIQAEIDSDSVDLASVKANNGFVNNGIITWNAAGVNSLENLTPGETATVKYSFRVKDPATQTDQKNISINLNAKVKSNENSEFIQSPPLIIKISSPVDVTVKAEHSGGALPPVVGVSSAFNVDIELSNNSNEMTNGVLIAYIPTGASLDPGTFSSNEKNFASFDKATGKITWNFGQIVPHAGITKLPRVLSFLVTITPASSQLGDNVELLKDVTLIAEDSFTGAAVEADGNNVDTGDLPPDPETGETSLGRVQN